MLALPAVAALLLLGVRANLVRHDASFRPDYVLEASEAVVPINCEPRRSVVVNGTTPGPLLRMTEGQTTWVRVYNRMHDQNLTMHWHGLAQKTAPFSDGTPLVSQWPIPPGHYFDYEVRPEVGDAGTYFYHSHVGFQQLTAHGALIVDEADAEAARAEHGDDVVLVLGDHYPAEDAAIEAGLFADPFRWSGEPKAVLVQGRSGTAGFGNATADASCRPHVIDVEPGRTYRLRVIGATALSLVKLAIEDHARLDVVEADGGATEPAPIDHMQVAPGQRFSFRLRTKTARELREAGRRRHFWVRYESRERPVSVAGYALLRYRGGGGGDRDRPEDPPGALPAEPPVRPPVSTSDYLEHTLTPASVEERALFPPAERVNRTVVIQMNQMLTSGVYENDFLNGSLVWVQNGFAWKEGVQAAANQVPYLISLYTGQGPEPDFAAAAANAGFDSGTKTFPARVGEVIDIVWQNNGGVTGNFDVHPMHIHGEHAWDLGSGNGSYHAGRNNRRIADAGRVPARRDTTVLYRYAARGRPHTTAGWRGWRVRVTADNVGAWMMHCHIAQHAAMGMNTVWVFGGVADIRRRFRRNAFTPADAEGYLSYKGPAYGNAHHYPSMNTYFQPARAEAPAPPPARRPTAASASRHCPARSRSRAPVPADEDETSDPPAY